MSFFNRNGRKGPLLGVYSPDYRRFFLPGSTITNAEIYPDFIIPHNGAFYVLNYGVGDIAENANGDHPSGWINGNRNRQKVDEIVNQFPKQMLKNLVLAAGQDGNPVPIAGAYFTKLLDHTPGTVEPFSSLITDADGKINELTIQGNLSLSGDSDADTALNTFGKNNEIDCGFIVEE